MSASVFFLAPLRLASFCKLFSHGCGDSALRPLATGPHTGPQRSKDLPYFVFCRLIVLLHNDVLGGLDLYETIEKNTIIPHFSVSAGVDTIWAPLQIISALGIVFSIFLIRPDFLDHIFFIS